MYYCALQTEHCSGNFPLFMKINFSCLDVNHSIDGRGSEVRGRVRSVCTTAVPPSEREPDPAVLSDNKTSRQEDFTTVLRSLQVTEEQGTSVSVSMLSTEALPC